MLIVNLSYHKIFRNAATVMLSGQVADGVTTIFAGELVCHSNKIYVYNWLHLSKKKKKLVAASFQTWRQLCSISFMGFFSSLMPCSVLLFQICLTWGLR